ncbi:putative phage tail protein [uncultured Megamonas sp.]|uniref:putative phage tail protein n=1 Tax=uncultured Megamonas sp. TaxID=286140 RepID=UPI00259BF42E|nr:putative phage tail protein [uncultured Megamonas sp.]
MDNLEREVKVQRYYPNVIANSDEFKQLAILENEEFKSIWEVLFKWFKNKFVYEADLQGIQRWEEMLKIIPKNKETLEDRRSNILVKINSILPYTIRRLKQILDFKFGKDNAIPLTTKNYELIINFNNEIELNAKIMRALLRAIIPANLIFKIIISWNFEQNIYNKANINQYIDSTHNFWNLGTTEKFYWDGSWYFNNNINWSGENPNLIYKDRQTHSIFLYSLLTPNLEKKILSKLKNKQYISSIYSNCITHDEIQNNFINAKENLEIKYDNKIQENINANQNHITDKNCWDGSFCLDGSHILSGTYEINKQMENICVFYSTKHGIVNEGSREIL